MGKHARVGKDGINMNIIIMLTDNARLNDVHSCNKIDCLIILFANQLKGFKRGVYVIILGQRIKNYCIKSPFFALMYFYFFFT